MNSKTEKVFEKILSDGDLGKKFLNLVTPDEMYKFFLQIDRNISKGEFDEFVSVALENYKKIPNREISYEELQNIAGGGLGVKVAPGMLSLLFLIPSSGNASAKDFDIASTASGLFVSAKNKTQDAASYIAQTAKSGFVKTADWIKNNPKKAVFIATSISTAVALGTLVYKHHKSKLASEEPKKEEKSERKSELKKQSRQQEEAKRKAKEKEQSKQQEEVKRKAKEKEQSKQQEEAKRKAEEEREWNEEVDARIRDEAQERAKQEAEAKRKAEEEQRQADEEERSRAEEEEHLQQQEEEQRKFEKEEAKRKAEEEREWNEEVDARIRDEAQERAKQEAEQLKQ